MIWRFGEIEVDAQRFTVERAGALLELTRMQFDLLCCLLQRQGQVVLRETLEQQLWPETRVVRTALPRLVSLLRGALDDNAESPRYIATVRSRGYRFMHPVTSDSEGGSEPGDGEQLASADPMRPRSSMGGCVPRLPLHFVGRTRELGELVARTCSEFSESTAVSAGPPLVLSGVAGMGKSTLAGALLHHAAVRGRFPDGVLWCRLGEAPDLAFHLRVWARSMGFSPPNLESLELDELASRLAYHVRSRRLLLVIDDVWDARHAITMRIGGAPSRAIVTTRLPAIATQLQSGGSQITLSSLTPKDAWSLLEAICPEVVQSHPKPCERLLQDCHGLPLVIEMVGQRLQDAYQTGSSVPTVLSRLASDPQMLSDLPLPVCTDPTYGETWRSTWARTLSLLSAPALAHLRAGTKATRGHTRPHRNRQDDGVVAELARHGVVEASASGEWKVVPALASPAGRALLQGDPADVTPVVCMAAGD